MSDKSSGTVSVLRWLIILLLLFVLGIGVASLIMFPWGPIRGLEVERQSYLAVDAFPDPSRPKFRRVGIVFSTPMSLEAFREQKDAGFIRANMWKCDGSGNVETEAITQRGGGGYLVAGRVWRLRTRVVANETRHRYFAVMDDPRDIERTFADLPPSSDTPPLSSLCFSLDGSSMWMGKLWSKHIRLGDRATE